jgi:peptidoglycan/LPS O-acetylase OafA/YrhL
LAGSSLAFFLGASVGGPLYFTGDFTTSTVQIWSLLTLSPTWSLELELWFYLLAPFLLRLRLRWILGIAAASFTLRLAWYHAATRSTRGHTGFFHLNSAYSCSESWPNVEISPGVAVGLNRRLRPRGDGDSRRAFQVT